MAKMRTPTESDKSQAKIWLESALSNLDRNEFHKVKKLCGQVISVLRRKENEGEPRIEKSEQQLRDEFAASAMQGLLAKQGGYAGDMSFPGAMLCSSLSEDVMNVDEVAEYAYAQADAMLAARRNH